MALHRLKLYFISRKNSIIFFLTVLGMFTALFVGIYLLIATQAHSIEIRKNQEQNRQLLKGLSCILLILPEDRSQDKIRECIEINSDSEHINYEFFFESLEKSQTIKEDPDFIDLIKEELRGDQGFRGSDGVDGMNGVDGKDGKDSVSVKTVIKEQVPVKGDIGQAGREVEFQYNNLKQRIEWRYVGESFWQVLVDACELTNTCQP